MRRTAVVLLGATALCLTTAPALAAEGDPVTGYWSRTQAGLPVPVQPPDPVPEGGTWVASDPSGPIAVSALRTGLAEGLVAVELRLTVADSVGTPAVQACPSSDAWAPEQNGRLEGAPIADCSAPLETKLDGDVLVVPLPPVDLVNVLLRPAPGSAFSITFERATAASVVTAPRPAPLAAPPPLPLGPPPGFPAPAPAFDSAVLAPFAAPAEDVAAAPLLSVPELAPPAAAAPAPAPQTAPVQLTAPVARPRPAAGPETRTEVLLAVAVLVLLGAQAARLAVQPAAAPRPLGGSARRTRVEPEAPPLEVLVPARGVGRFRTEPVLGVRTAAPRGVGRFRTARTQPPVRL